MTIAIKLYLLKYIIIYRMNFEMIGQKLRYISEYKLQINFQFIFKDITILYEE